LIDVNDGVCVDSCFGGEGDYFLFGVDVFGGVVDARDDFAFFFGGHALRFGGHDGCDDDLGGMKEASYVAVVASMAVIMGLIVERC